MAGHDECHETVDTATREDLLEEYKYRCQGCGRCGPEAGGMATLEVHHLLRDPEEMDLHDPRNLSVLCRSCHLWQHQQTDESEVPVEISEADRTELRSQGLEVLRILAESGPLTTGEVADALSTDPSMTSVRARLWELMGLPSLVPSRDKQIVDKDVDTGKWGLVEQIEHPARGRIPTDPQTLSQRIQDELVRQALDRGVDRQKIMAVFGISRRTTFHRRKRAHAYDLPWDAINQGSGGRPPADDAGDDTGAASTEERAEPAGDGQQQLDTVADGGSENTATADVGDPGGGASSGEGGSEADESWSAQPEVQEHIQQAIAALQTLDEAL